MNGWKVEDQQLWIQKKKKKIKLKTVLEVWVKQNKFLFEGACKTEFNMRCFMNIIFLTC